MYTRKRIGIPLQLKKHWRIHPTDIELARHLQKGQRGILSKRKSRILHWQQYVRNAFAYTGVTHKQQCNPPFVFGPIVHYLNSLDALNTSNARIRDIAFGACKNGLMPTGTHLWIDVRDLAEAHVLAAEKPDAAGKRFFLTAGSFSNKEIAEIIRENFPELAKNLPEGEALKPGDYPEGGMPFGFDNSRSKEVLGMKYRTLNSCIVDTVESLLAVGA